MHIYTNSPSNHWNPLYEKYLHTFPGIPGNVRNREWKPLPNNYHEEEVKKEREEERREEEDRRTWGSKKE